MAIGLEKKVITEDKILAAALKEIEGICASELDSQEKIFKAQREAAYALREIASGETFTWTKRLTCVVEKTDSGMKLRHTHWSYPFYWILAGK